MSRLDAELRRLLTLGFPLQALLPLRILVSLRLAPPMANVIVKRFKGLRDMGARYLKKQS